MFSSMFLCIRVGVGTICASRQSDYSEVFFFLFVSSNLRCDGEENLSEAQFYFSHGAHREKRSGTRVNSQPREFRSALSCV